MSGAENAGRVFPLMNVVGKHEHSWSRYYDYVRLPMKDGQVITYRIENRQPHPSFVKAIGSIRTGYKYGYVGKHAKK